MIIVKLQGGLGNQMFQYSLAKSISIKKDIEVKLDLNNYENDYFNREYRINDFNIIENIASNKEIKKLRGYEGFFRIFFNKLGLEFPKRPKSFYKEKSIMHYCSDVYNGNDMYFDGFWQDENYFIEIRELLLSEFSPKEITTKAQQYLKMINNNSVSMHIRREDYLKLQNIYYICDLNYYKNAISFIKKKVENPTFFIFSDDIEWCKNNFNENFIFVNETVDVDDMFLMSKCTHHIIANSTFSWWGAWLNRNENKIVIAPKKWFVDSRKDKNINVKKWIYI